MSDGEDFSGVEHSKCSVTKNSLTFLLEGIDPRDLAADGLSIVSFADSEWSAGGVREEPTCQELAIEGECLTKQGNHKEAIPLLESALELGTDDMQLLSVLWSLLGNAHFYLGDYEKASICHQHDLAICNELGDERNQAQAYCNLGIANRKTGYLQRAKLCYERYLDICEKIEDSRAKSKAHHNLGDLHLTLARLKLSKSKMKLEDAPEAKEHLNKAAEYFLKHLDYVKETQNKSAEARVHGSLGYVYELLLDIDKAIDHYEQRLKIAVEISDKGAEARSYCSIGNCLRALIQPEKSIVCYKRGLAISQELEDQLGEGVVSGNLGMACEILCNLEEAQEHFQKQLETMRSQNNLHGEAMALDNIARTHEYMANMNKACEALEALLPIYQKLKNEEEVQETQSRINRLNDMRGAPKAKEGSGVASSATAASGSKEGGTGIIGTWKKLKGKKKKQRNMTAPEIRTEDLKEAMDEMTSTSSTTLTPLKEDGAEKKDGGKTKGRFGKKSKEKTTPGELVKQKSGTMGEVVLRNEQVESPTITDQNAALSQSNHTLSQLSDHPTESDIGILPVDVKRKSDVIILEPLDLSQTSEKHSGMSLSQPDPFVGHDDRLSTQSSSDIPISNALFDTHRNDSSSGVWESRNTSREDGDVSVENRLPFQHGSSKLYKEYGSKEHKLNLERVVEFLKSSGEAEPVDLSVLHDWDGWMVASREIRLPSTTKESQLI